MDAPCLPLYTCAVCGLAVLVIPKDDGDHEIIRGCSHDGAVVHANLVAHVIGVSDLSMSQE